MNDGLRSNVSWSCGWRRREGMTAEATQHYSEPPMFEGHCSGSFAKGLPTVYEKPRIRLAFDTGSWVPLGTFEQYHSVYSLCGSASVVVVCEDILRECGSFLVVEHWRDIEVHERIPHTEIAI